MVSSPIPLMAAVVAAPIQKECPEKCVASIPAVAKVSLSHDTRNVRVNGCPSGRMNSGASRPWLGRMAK